MIINSYFSKNIAYGVKSNSGGGAIFFKYSKDNRIKNVTFAENYVKASGGAIFFNKDSCNNQTIEDSYFYKNEADGLKEFNGAISDYGGGAIFYDSSSNGAIVNTIFEENSALTYAGAIYYSGKSNNQSIINSTFYRNTGKSNDKDHGGGAIRWDGSNGRVVNSNFTENSVAASGGAIYYNKAANNQLITDSYFYNNTANGNSNSFGGTIVAISKVKACL